MTVFGRYKGEAVRSSVLENEYLRVETMSLGATLLSLTDKESGKDIVLGFPTLKGYLDQHNSYLGASVGRCANRIGGASFTLNGERYELPQNDGENCLHGGKQNFAWKNYAIEEGENVIVYRGVSEDGEEGFPGRLEYSIAYLLNGRELTWIYAGKSDKDTILNMTNHSYFNLLGSVGRTVLGQTLLIPSEEISLLDEHSLTLEETLPVAGTAFDFRTPKKIAEAFRDPHPNMKAARGIDHNYVFEDQPEGLRAVLSSSELKLSVYSDLPGMHVYTANWLEENEGKNGYNYGPQDGICFECQYAPNAVNCERYRKPILPAGETMRHYIRYRLERNEG